jgi:hypothetical protein
MSSVFHPTDLLVFPAHTEHARLILLAVCEHEDEKIHFEAARAADVPVLVALCDVYGIPHTVQQEVR